jgi:hypothetical protein
MNRLIEASGSRSWSMDLAGSRRLQPNSGFFPVSHAGEMTLLSPPVYVAHQAIISMHYLFSNKFSDTLCCTKTSKS